MLPITGGEPGDAMIAIHPRGEPDNLVRAYTGAIYDPDAAGADTD